VKFPIYRTTDGSIKLLDPEQSPSPMNNEDIERLSDVIVASIDYDRRSLVKLAAFLTLSIAAIQGDSVDQVAAEIATDCEAIFCQELTEV
jgi:hypothetical protein